MAAELRAATGAVVLGKKTSHLFRPLEKAPSRLDVRDFDEVLSVDEGTLIADVEGMATFEQIVRQTLRHGLLPAIAIELKGITCGGAVSGVAIEASSFRFGLFHQTVEEMEVLVPSGDVFVCSPDQNSDLFYAMPNSYGTLGYITRLKLRLIRAKPFVHARYQKYSDPEAFLNEMERLSRPDADHDFVEGVAFAPDSLVISVARFADDAPYVSDYTFMKPYYKSLRGRKEDYLPAEQFIFRWDADWFWGSRGNIMGVPVLRFLLGKWLLSSRFYMRLLRLDQRCHLRQRLPFLGGARENVIQDILIPRQGWAEYLDFVLNDLKILPIWLCAFPGAAQFSLLPLKAEPYMDFGIWGSFPAKSPGYWNRIVEAKTAELGGVKSLYSEVFYTREEFWKNSDKDAYERVKAKYDPEHRLLGLYEKVTGRSGQIRRPRLDPIVRDARISTEPAVRIAARIRAFWH